MGPMGPYGPIWAPGPYGNGTQARAHDLMENIFFSRSQDPLKKHGAEIMCRSAVESRPIDLRQPHSWRHNLKSGSKQTNKQTNRYIDRQQPKQTNKQTHKPANKQTNKQTKQQNKT